MMTLQFKKCVSLFVCLSLLLSACSPGKSSKAGGFVRSAACLSGLVVSPLTDKSSKANEFASNTVELAYDLCSNKGKVIVEAGKPITSIGKIKMECTTEIGKATCTKKDKTKCELKKVELCNELGEDCKDFEFGVTPVPCNGPSDKSEGACRPMSLRATKQEEGAKEGTKKEQEQEKREEIANEIDGLCSTDECKNDVKIIKGLLKEVADITKSIITKSISELFREELDKGKSANDRAPSIGQGESSLDGGGVGKSVLDNKPNPSANARNISDIPYLEYEAIKKKSRAS